VRSLRIDDGSVVCRSRARADHSTRLCTRRGRVAARKSAPANANFRAGELRFLEAVANQIEGGRPAVSTHTLEERGGRTPLLGCMQQCSARGWLTLVMSPFTQDRYLVAALWAVCMHLHMQVFCMETSIFLPTVYTHF
jgi:hypothetical protein